VSACGPIVTFAQFSDSHLRADRRKHQGVDAVSALETAVRSLGSAVEFVVHTGDLVSRPADVESYRLYRKIAQGLECPIWHLPGNHDEVTLMRRELGATVPDFPWSFSSGGIRFIGLNSSEGSVAEEELGRLATLLAEGGDVLLFLHHHLGPIEDSWLNPFALQNPQELGAVLRSATSRILGIFHGHIHYYSQMSFLGFPVFSAPALTSQFDPFGAFLSVGHEPPAYTEVAVYPDGRVSRTLHPCGARVDGSLEGAR